MLLGVSARRRNTLLKGRVIQLRLELSIIGDDRRAYVTLNTDAI
jgi:hypothetical protein